MFDFSFGEIFVIAVVAVIFLGPDKLPQAFVKIAKFLRAVKKTINDAKDTLDREIHITEMKQDALEYKKKFADSAEKLKNEILQDADVEGIKREIEGAKSAAILNESLEKSSISFDEVENRGKAMQKRLKNNLKQKNAESSLDSANQTKIAESNFSCHSERSEESKNIPSLRADSQNLRGNPPCENITESQNRLPRSHSLARNDEILDSSLRLRSAQNDNVGAENDKIKTENDKLKKSAESSKKPKKSALDSAESQNLTDRLPLATSRARNDEILDSSLRLRSAQNDKVGAENDKIKIKNDNLRDFAESSKKSKKSALDSANSQNLKDKLPRTINRARNDDSLLDSANKKPKKSPKKSPKRAKNERAKTNGS